MDAEDFLDGPPGQGLGHVDGKRLNRVKIQIESWSGFAKGTPGDDFPPAVDQVTQFRPILGLAPDKRHSQFVLELADREELENRP